MVGGPAGGALWESEGDVYTFDGGCEVFLPAGTVPENEGERADLQFAVFK